MDFEGGRLVSLFVSLCYIQICIYLSSSSREKPNHRKPSSLQLWVLVCTPCSFQTVLAIHTKYIQPATTTPFIDEWFVKVSADVYDELVPSINYSWHIPEGEKHPLLSMCMYGLVKDGPVVGPNQMRFKPIIHSRYKHLVMYDLCELWTLIFRVCCFQYIWKRWYVLIRLNETRWYQGVIKVTSYHRKIL